MGSSRLRVFDPHLERKDPATAALADRELPLPTFDVPYFKYIDEEDEDEEWSSRSQSSTEEDSVDSLLSDRYVVVSGTPEKILASIPHGPCLPGQLLTDDRVPCFPGTQLTQGGVQVAALAPVKRGFWPRPLSLQDAGDRGCGLPAPGLVRLAECLLLFGWAHPAVGGLRVQVSPE